SLIGPSAGKRTSGEQDVCLEKQLERFEWQLRTLKEVLSANGNPERAELLKDHADEDVCALVLSILDKVKTETTTLQRMRMWCKRTSGEQDVCLEKQLERFEWQLRTLKEVLSANGNPERAELLKDHADEDVCALVLSILDKCVFVSFPAGLQKTHEEEKNQLTETFRAAEGVLTAEVDQLTSELQVYNELKKRVQESTFKKDLQRNIQAHGSPGAFWESEQESLLFVIEMKSERVQDQSRKLQQMDDLDVGKGPKAAQEGPSPGRVRAESGQSLGRVRAESGQSPGRVRAKYGPSMGQVRAEYGPSTGRLQAVSVSDER
ncbi:coiled-coil domain-containing protein 69-like, partial [Seriola lalandi dorsalis]|uniref:coiled-coil domain-containing protein 69-like n=1 Tax=Seriola lalandi dorsalis TaxID=1841481 RepID=UPI000C6F648E